MKIAIMTDEVGWHTRQLQRALRERGAMGRCVDLADCEIRIAAPAERTRMGLWHGLVLPSFGQHLPDAVLVRGVAGGSFEQVTKRLGVLHALQALGVPVYNEARGIERSVDKSMTSLLLCAAGVPTPATWTTESWHQACQIVMQEAAQGHAVVLKPLFGSQGKGLLRLGWVEGQFVPMPAPDAVPGRLVYLQRFIPAPAPGFDWRVLVIGGRAVAAMRRVSEHWVHNVAQGARCEPAVLTPDLAQTAEAACAALQLDYAGVDLMPTLGPEPIQVLEVNGVAAWRGLQRVTPFNIAQALVNDLLDRKLVGAEAGAGARALTAARSWPLQA